MKVLQDFRDLADELLRAAAGTSTGAQAAPASQPQRQWMRISEFARAHGYAQRTVASWVKLGMPHVGTGRHCRIQVAAAEQWLRDGGPANARRMLGMKSHGRARRPRRTLQ